MSSRLLNWILSFTGERLGYRDLDEVRRKVERQQTRPARYGPPKRLSKSCTVELSFGHGWPCYEIAPRGRVPKARVLYLHGGAYIEEVGLNHWALVKDLARDVPATVTVPVYPLAPAGTADSVLPGLTALARTLTSDPELPAVFMGDSAGGGLSLVLAQRLRDEGAANAGRLVLIAPWLDAVLDDPALALIQPHDPMLAVEPLRWTGSLWAGRRSPADPAVSPVNGAMAGLPPAEVYSGTRDILLSDARRFAELARAAGVPVDLHEEEGQVHAYPLWPIAEGHKARERIVAGVRGVADRDGGTGRKRPRPADRERPPEADADALS